MKKGNPRKQTESSVDKLLLRLTAFGLHKSLVNIFRL